MTDAPVPNPDADTLIAQRVRALAPSKGGRPWTFYVLASVFVLYVIAFITAIWSLRIWRCVWRLRKLTFLAISSGSAIAPPTLPPRAVPASSQTRRTPAGASQQ